MGANLRRFPAMDVLMKMKFQPVTRRGNLAYLRGCNLFSMKLAYIIFDGITWLDLIGIYDPISRLKSMKYLPELEWDICANTSNSRDPFGLTVIPDKVSPSLSSYDAIIVPGGHGTRELQSDASFLNWIKTSSPTALKISVCTGSLILGGAGFLKDKSATTNFAEYEALKPYCRQVSKERIVQDGNVITAGAVSASIDLGLYLCNSWSGPEAMAEIRKRMDYHG
jgi:transcriptional regulator GlxA family with amidase domain